MRKKEKDQQRLKDVPLVAIDLGSNGVRAMAARSLGPNLLHILGVEKNSKFACINKGAVMQTGSAGFMINEALKLLANRIGVEEIQSAFVVLGGHSMKCIDFTDRQDLLRETYLTRDLLNKKEQECCEMIEKRNPNISILGMIPNEYVLDGKAQDDTPQPHQKATILDTHYTAFVGTKELKQKTIDSFNRAGKFLEKGFVRMDALLSAFAFDNEEILSSGCAILDMGAQTSSLCVYKQNQYLFSKVIALGGWNITRYLEQQGISIRIAEELKCKYGFAAPEFVEKNYKMTIPAIDEMGGKIEMTSNELAENIQMKLNEIMQPVLEALKPYENRITTLFITGAGSKLQGFPEYLQKQTKLEVMYGSHAALLDNQTPDEYYSPEYSSLVGALILGADYRREHKQQIPPKNDLFGAIKQRFEQGTLNLFIENNTDK